MLDHLGLNAALQAALQQFAERTEIACQLHDHCPPLRLAPAKATAVYRIYQEALTNIARHASASAVTLRLDTAPALLRVEIEDNGRRLLILTPTGKSIGLVSMAERAREFGGSLSTRPGSSGGTCLILQLPLNEEESA